MPWSEDQYKAAGLVQVKVRLRRETIEMLDALVGDGEDRGKVITRLVEEAIRAKANQKGST